MNEVTGAFAGGGEAGGHLGGDDLVAVAVADQDRAGDAADLATGCRTGAAGGATRAGTGSCRRAMSAMRVNVQKATSPATGFREARSIATAPPSDQPAATISPGSTSCGARRWARAASAVS